MKQHEVASLFAHMADLLEFRGANPFRVRAYRKAVQTLERLPGDLELWHREERLKEIPGIGHDLGLKIEEYLTTGSIREIEQLKQTVPAGVVEIMTIPSVGPKTTKLLYERLRITSVRALERAARAHKLCRLPGFQEKKEHNILQGIQTIRRGQERMDLGVALSIAGHVMDSLRALREVKRIAYAGSLRRMQETIGDLDILVTATKPARVIKAFTTAKFCARVLAAGETKSSILMPDGHQVDLRVVDPSSFGAALQYFTGSKEHNVRLREFAVRKGLKVNEYGVFRVKTGKRLAGKEEQEVYAALGLPWIPPEIREDAGELDAAMAGRLPKLVEEGDLRGDFHIHTQRSDGHHTLSEVAAAAAKRGYEFLAITDHSKSLRIAHGMSEKVLREQMAEIAAFNKRSRRLKLLAGAEVDILQNGVMDYPNEVLRKLDFVIGSIHTGFKQDRATITRRLVKAMENPYVTLIAHPTGRLLGQREAYAVDMDAVIDAARRTRTALEINANPKRLDLNDQMARRAREHGVTLAVSTDTHDLKQLGYIGVGVAVARRAWSEPKDLLNCLTRPRLMAWIKQKRQRV